MKQPIEQRWPELVQNAALNFCCGASRPWTFISRTASISPLVCDSYWLLIVTEFFQAFAFDRAIDIPLIGYGLIIAALGALSRRVFVRKQTLPLYQHREQNAVYMRQAAIEYVPHVALQKG